MITGRDTYARWKNVVLLLGACIMLGSFVVGCGESNDESAGGGDAQPTVKEKSEPKPAKPETPAETNRLAGGTEADAIEAVKEYIQMARDLYVEGMCGSYTSERAAQIGEVAPENLTSAGGNFNEFAECGKELAKGDDFDFEEFRKPITRWRVLSASISDGGKSATVKVSGGKTQNLKWDDDPRKFRIDFDK